MLPIIDIDAYKFLYVRMLQKVWLFITEKIHVAIEIERCFLFKKILSKGMFSGNIKYEAVRRRKNNRYRV